MVDSLKWAHMPSVRDDVKPLTIVHLFPELLNLYGDGGNVIALTRRLQWRGLPVEVREIGMGDAMDFSQADIVFIGGGADREQMIVKDAMVARKSELSAYVADGGVLLAVCGGYQFLGHSYAMDDVVVEGLGVIDMETVRGEAVLSAMPLSKAIFAMRRLSGSKTTADARRSAPTQSRLAACSAKHSATMVKTALRACIRATLLEPTCMVLCCRKTRRSPTTLSCGPLTVAAMRLSWPRLTMPLSLRQIA